MFYRNRYLFFIPFSVGIQQCDRQRVLSGCQLRGHQNQICRNVGATVDDVSVQSYFYALEAARCLDPDVQRSSDDIISPGFCEVLKAFDELGPKRPSPLLQTGRPWRCLRWE